MPPRPSDDIHVFFVLALFRVNVRVRVRVRVRIRVRVWFRVRFGVPVNGLCGSRRALPSPSGRQTNNCLSKTQCAARILSAPPR